MKNPEKHFFNVFTDLQCYILAGMNTGNINGVTATHYNLVEFIYRNDQINGKEIAKRMSISQAAVSKQLKFLIENKFIQQEQNPKDRRIFNLETTAKGRFLVDNSEGFRTSFTKQAADILTKAEFNTLTGLLEKLMSKMNN